MKSRNIEVYYCPFSGSCSYLKTYPETKRYGVVERKDTNESIFANEKIRKPEYTCRALDESQVNCLWVELLNKADLNMLVTFAALKNINCMAYAAKMTSTDEE